MSQLQARSLMVTRILVGASAACACLAVALWLLAGPSAPEGELEPVDVTLPGVRGILLAADGDYPMMVERPLFWPERAPTPAEGAAGGNGSAVAGPDGLVYLGEFVKGSVKQVWLSDGGSVHVLREGETIRNLTVKQISGRGVTLASGSEEIRLPASVDTAESIKFRRLE